MSYEQAAARYVAQMDCRPIMWGMGKVFQTYHFVPIIKPFYAHRETLQNTQMVKINCIDDHVELQIRTSR